MNLWELNEKMTDNEGYANLLELYAKFIRDEDYSLSSEQKKLIKELGAFK